MSGAGEILFFDEVDIVMVIDAVRHEVLSLGLNSCEARDPITRARERVHLADTLTAQTRRPHVVLSGRCAATLYEALAGHRYGVESVELANAQRARCARAVLLSWRDREPDYGVACLAVEAFGPVMKPWLGLPVFDAAGRLMEWAPEYDERVPL